MDFRKVKELLDDALEQHQVPCSDVIITKDGKTVYRYRNGYRDTEKKIPLKGDELYFLYSATKVVTCTAACQLLEQGKIRLEDRLSDYIPEYREMWVKTEEGIKKADNPILIKHLFTMTSGLNYELVSKSIREQLAKNPVSSTLDLVSSFAKEPLEFEPGTHYLYSLSHDVLAAVVEVVSGMSFGDYLKKYIFDVCGMTRTGFELNDEIRSQMCSQWVFSEETQKTGPKKLENEFILSPAYQSGGAGLISCVDDYIKFSTEMANGNRILKAETIDLMRADHLDAQTRADFHEGVKEGYTYGLGVRTDVEGVFAAKGEYGWDGAAGSYTLIDPDRHIAFFYATHVRDYGEYLVKVLQEKLRDIVYQELS